MVRVAAGPPFTVLTPPLLGEVHGVAADLAVHDGRPVITYRRPQAGQERDRDRSGPVGAGAGCCGLRCTPVNPLQAARYRESGVVSRRRHAARTPAVSASTSSGQKVVESSR